MSNTINKYAKPNSLLFLITTIEISKNRFDCIEALWLEKSDSPRFHVQNVGMHCFNLILLVLVSVFTPSILAQ